MKAIDCYTHPQFNNNIPGAIVSDESLEIIMAAPKKSKKAFIILKNHYNPKTNIAFLPTDKLTHRQLTYRVDCLKVYEVLGFIKKVPTTGLVNMYGVPQNFDKYTYMIAPDHFLPKTIEDYIYASHLWSQL